MNPILRLWLIFACLLRGMFKIVTLFCLAVTGVAVLLACLVPGRKP